MKVKQRGVASQVKKVSRKHPLEDSTAEDVVPAKRMSKGRTSITQILRSVPPVAIEGPTTPQKKILSVNIPGLRALLDNYERRHQLKQLLEQQQPTILLLQEHKLQHNHLDSEPVKNLLENELKGYDGHWAFSTTKKGYSGVASFVRKGTAVLGVNIGLEPLLKEKLGKSEFDKEGRIMSLELEGVNIVNVYVPNSGQQLERLEKRTKQWDKLFGEYILALEKATNKPVLALGDFNVAYRVEDIHNFYDRPNFEEMRQNSSTEASETQYSGVKAVAKQAGCTVEERQSFGQLLAHTGLVDSFVHFHPQSQGCFTYWSHRSGNKQFNRGLRLDYALASPALLSPNCSVRLLSTDHVQQVLTNDWGLSDHCPISCTLKTQS